MVKHGLARAGAAAGDDVDDAGGEHLVEELAELEERKRRRRGGLDHERVARGEGRRDLPGAHQEREVPRNDLADDADGLVQHDAHRVFVDHDGGALFGAQATGEVAEVVGGERNIDERGFADRLAVVERFDHGETGGVFIDEIGDLQKKGGALLRGLGGPGGEGGAGGGDGTVDVGGRGVGAVGELLAVGGIERLEGFAAFGGNPFAVDEQIVLGVNVLHFRSLHGQVRSRSRRNCSDAFYQ